MNQKPQFEVAIVGFGPAGAIAACWLGQAGVKTLVLSHLVPGDDPSITDAMWTDGVRQHFKGDIIVGRDLLEV